MLLQEQLQAAAVVRTPRPTVALVLTKWALASSKWLPGVGISSDLHTVQLIAMSSYFIIPHVIVYHRLSYHTLSCYMWLMYTCIYQLSHEEFAVQPSVNSRMVTTANGGSMAPGGCDCCSLELPRQKKVHATDSIFRAGSYVTLGQSP